MPAFGRQLGNHGPDEFELFARRKPSLHRRRFVPDLETGVILKVLERDCPLAHEVVQREVPCRPEQETAGRINCGEARRKVNAGKGLLRQLFGNFRCRYDAAQIPTD